MKTRIALIACVSAALLGGLRSSVRAERAVLSPQAPATSATERSQSVWDGIYTAEQATRGGALYLQKCAHCHGQDLTGGETAPALASGDFKSNWSGLSVDD